MRVGRVRPFWALWACFDRLCFMAWGAFAGKMACFGAVQARAELGVLSAARTSSTTPTADTVPAAVPENRQMSVVGRPKEPILH